MTLRHALTALLLALGLTLGSPMVSGGAAPAPGVEDGAAPSVSLVARAEAAAGPKVKTVYFTMFSEQQVRPKRIYLHASSTQYLRRLTWRHWGDPVARARGLFISDCSTCPPPAKRKARVVFSKRTFCADEGVRTYRKAIVHLSKPSEGSDTTRFRVDAGCPPG